MGGGCGARKMRGTRTAPLGPWPLRTVSITRHGYEGGERETRDTPTVDSMCARRSVPALCKLYGGCLQRMPAADAGDLDECAAVRWRWCEGNSESRSEWDRAQGGVGGYYTCARSVMAYSMQREPERFRGVQRELSNYSNT